MVNKLTKSFTKDTQVLYYQKLKRETNLAAQVAPLMQYYIKLSLLFVTWPKRTQKSTTMAGIICIFTNIKAVAFEIGNEPKDIQTLAKITIL